MRPSGCEEEVISITPQNPTLLEERWKLSQRGPKMACCVMYVFFHLISIVLSDFMTFHKTFFVSISDLADHFLGNSTHVDYFKLLRKDGSSLLIGARNVIYNLSLPDLKENIEQVR